MNVIQHRINSDYLYELTRFADSDKDITNCRQKLHDEVFRHKWFVALFDQDAPFYQMPFLNKPFFKNQLQLFYLKAHDFLIRFGFVGYYHYKDMDAWIEYVSTDVSIDEDGEEGEIRDIGVGRELEQNILDTFPFGIIPVGITPSYKLGQYVLLENRDTLQETVVFDCYDDDLSNRFEFHVINRGATFVPMREYTEEHALNVSIVSTDLVPTSQFVDLYQQKQLIKEATKSLFDANSMHVYPESFIIAKPEKDAVLDDVADDTLYGLDSILNAKQHDNMERERMGLDNARYHAQRISMKRTVKGSGGRCGSQQVTQPSTVIWDEKIKNNRPSNYEAIQFIPRSVEIVAGKSGSPIVNVDRRVAKYELDACRAMRVPHSFINPDVSSFGSAGDVGIGVKRSNKALTSNAENERNQKLLENEVKKHHTLFDEIFTEIYGHTFGKMDAQVFHVQQNAAFLLTLEPGIYFDYIPANSDTALNNLTRFYELGIVPLDEMKRVVYKEFNIRLPTELMTEHIVKKRKIDNTPLPTIAIETKEEMEAEPSPIAAIEIKKKEELF